MKYRHEWMRLKRRLFEVCVKISLVSVPFSKFIHINKRQITYLKTLTQIASQGRKLSILEGKVEELNWKWKNDINNIEWWNHQSPFPLDAQNSSSQTYIHNPYLQARNQKVSLWVKRCPNGKYINIQTIGNLLEKQLGLYPITIQ